MYHFNVYEYCHLLLYMSWLRDHCRFKISARSHRGANQVAIECTAPYMGSLCVVCPIWTYFAIKGDKGTSLSTDFNSHRFLVKKHKPVWTDECLRPIWDISDLKSILCLRLNII